MQVFLSIVSVALLALLAWQVWGSIWNIIAIFISLFKG